MVVGSHINWYVFYSIGGTCTLTAVKGKITMTKPILRKMSRTLWFLMAPLVLPAVVNAVTYPFPEREFLHVKVEAVMTAGTKVYLFHSGTDEVRKSIHVDDVLTVYREYPSDLSVETKEVGKIRVLAPLGDYYFDGEVVGGEVRAGDLAKKGTVACFVIAFKKNGHQQ
jgi:hypothetical protein